MRRGLLIITLSALLICASGAQTLKADATSPITGPSFQDPIVPTQPGHRLRSLTLSQTSVIAGTSFSGRIVLEFVAPSGGTTVYLTTNPLPGVEGENLVPSEVVVPRGEASAIFQVRTNPVQSTRQVTITAKAGGITRTASFTIQPLLATLVIAPPAGLGAFQATGTVTLNAPAPPTTVVRLESSNPDVVRFGNASSSQATRSQPIQTSQSFATFQVFARQVSQDTPVTIRATLNGRTVSQAMTVRAIP
jgi:hypothetical protein